MACGRTDRAHRRKGLCTTCAERTLLSDPETRRRTFDARNEYWRSSRGREVRRAIEQRQLKRPIVRERKRRHARIVRERSRGVIAELPIGYEGLVLEVFGHRCAACGSQEHLELDHHLPLEEGHALLHNAVPLCRPCNRRKRTKDPRDFYDAPTFASVTSRLELVRSRFERGLACAS